MKETIEAYLNPNAMEKMRAPKNPDIVLLIFSWFWVLGSGLFTTVIEISSLPLSSLMYVSAAKLCTVTKEVGDLLLKMEVKGIYVIESLTFFGSK